MHDTENRLIRKRVRNNILEVLDFSILEEFKEKIGEDTVIKLVDDAEENLVSISTLSSACIKDSENEYFFFYDFDKTEVINKETNIHIANIFVLTGVFGNHRDVKNDTSTDMRINTIPLKPKAVKKSHIIPERYAVL